ncbi:hypothetical protein PspLS_07530 [Pyricularia sp. CBS 133598]|nr:hypothetical protein PspLS_07530 [Pyricularia sp. CBS 133598]
MHIQAITGLLFIHITLVQGKTNEVPYDCTRMPGVCTNHCWAVNCMGHPEAVHGGNDQVDVEKNRKDWGYYTTGLKALGDDVYSSPEEYPFASSQEGGP